MMPTKTGRSSSSSIADLFTCWKEACRARRPSTSGSACRAIATSRNGRVSSMPLIPLSLLLEDRAILHHESHILERVDIAERIVGDRDDVGVRAGCDDAEVAGHVEEVG